MAKSRRNDVIIYRVCLWGSKPSLGRCVVTGGRVENKGHWVMDVCFREGQSRARAGYAAENLATLRRLTLNLLKRETTKKRGIRGKQLNASWDHALFAPFAGSLDASALRFAARIVDIRLASRDCKERFDS